MNKYAIFWIIGNENPPRDTPGQRLRILQQLLGQKYPEADGWFLLNRIVDISYRREVLDRISQANGKCVTIPFDQEHTLQGHTHEEIVRRAININDARNYALEFALALGYETVVILDGDCLFDQEGWDAFRAAADANPSLPNLSIPHITCRNLPGGLPDDVRPGEPMIAFRKFSPYHFDVSLPFGQGDKLALLRELGHDMTPDSGHCKLLRTDRTAIAGYCLHLQTGSDAAAADRPTREFLRKESMVQLVDRIRKRVLWRNRQPESAVPGYFDYSGQYSAVALDAPDNAHGVEVGCWQGRSVCYLAKEFAGYGKRVRIDCVDLWTGGKDEELVALVAAMGGPHKLFEAFQRAVEGIPQIGDIHECDSAKAARYYLDNSLDFVFLDAGHTYEEVRADIAAWLPKVKPGGLLFGHDFVAQHPKGIQVAKAVLAEMAGRNLEVMPHGRVWKHVKLTDAVRERRWV